MRLPNNDEKQSLLQSSKGAPEITTLIYDGLPQSVREVFGGPASQITSFSGKNNMRATHETSSRRPFVSISRLNAQALLLLAWGLMLWWGEKHVFSSHISTCKWSNWENWATQADPHHVVLLADPQLVDPHTYPGRPWPLSTLTIRHTDQYLRRSFTTLQKSLRPDTAFFLGDLFDGGREWSTGKSKSPEGQWRKYGQNFWLKEYDRFGKIFFEPWMRNGSPGGLLQNRKMIASLPGNHDLGIGGGIQIPVRDRFNLYFGGGNRIDTIGNHTFVSIDTVSLTAKGQTKELGEPASKEIWEHTEEFLANVKDKKEKVLQRELRSRLGQPENILLDHKVVGIEGHVDAELQKVDETNLSASMPTILLTHVPLFRNEGTPCGPWREHWPPSRTSTGTDLVQSDNANAISIRGGYQYQNVLHPQITKELIEKVGNVEHVFSGDDHDYCEVVHRGFTSRGGGVREITVKSLSWAMGVRRPGFLMVSLWNPVDEHGQPIDTPAPGLEASSGTLQSNLCLLPDQLSIFIRYGILLAITSLILAVQAYRIASQQTRHMHDYSFLPLSNPPTPSLDSKTRDRADSNSYASSMNSTISNGLAMRANIGRSRSLSPAYGYGYSTPETHMHDSSVAEQTPSYLPPPTPKPFVNSDSSTQDIHSEQTLKPWATKRWKATLMLFIRSWCQVASVALLWYAWLAYTV